MWVPGSGRRRCAPLLPLCFVLLTAACSPPPEAPLELSELSSWLFREWGSEDPRVLPTGVRNGEAFLRSVDLDTEAAERSWEPVALGPEDVEAITRPADRSLDRCLAVSIAYRSPWPIEDHALLHVQADQLPAQPTANYYDRTFPEEDDPSCFVDRRCEVLVTYNRMERQNVLLTVQAEMWKVLRWVDYEDGDGATRSAISTRSWFERSWYEEDGDAALLQSYGIDLYLADPTGGTVRYEVNWAETDLGYDVDPDAVRAVVRNGMDSSFGADDSYIEDLRGR